MLAKPQTFMNASGQSVSMFISKHLICIGFQDSSFGLRISDFSCDWLIWTRFEGWVHCILLQDSIEASTRGKISLSIVPTSAFL